MHKKLVYLFSTATFSQTVITTSGTVVNGLLGILFYILTARLLGSSNFGLFILPVSLIAALIPLFDLGSDQALIKFKTPMSQKHILVFKLVSGLIAIGLFWLLSPVISLQIFNKPQLQPLIPLVGVGIAAQLQFTFILGISQISSRFTIWSVQTISANSIRLLLVLGLVCLHSLTPTSLLVAYILSPFFSSLIFLPRIWQGFPQSSISLQVFKSLFSFGWLMSLSNLISALTSRLDQFFIVRFFDLATAGIYSLCQQLVSAISQLASGLGLVLSPKFSSFSTPLANSRYLTKTSLFSTTLAILAGAAVISIGWIVIPATGRDFSSGLPVLIVIAAAYSLFLATVPLRDSLLYFHTRPAFFTFTSLLNFLLTLIFGLWLIPQQGMMGAALVVLTNQVILTLISLLYYLSISRTYGQK